MQPFKTTAHLNAEQPSALRLFALADNGVTVLAGTANNMGYRVVVGGAPQLLDTVGDLEGMAFLIAGLQFYSNRHTTEKSLETGIEFLPRLRR